MPLWLLLLVKVAILLSAARAISSRPVFFFAMHKRPRLVDRDEETCRKRCLALMNIMVGSMPMAAKYALLRDEFEIFNAIDEACFVLGEQAEQESAAQRTQPMHKTELDGTSLHASSPSSRSAEHHDQAKQSIQCSVSPPGKMTEAVCHNGLDAKVGALIEKQARSFGSQISQKSS